MASPSRSFSKSWRREGDSRQRRVNFSSPFYTMKLPTRFAPHQFHGGERGIRTPEGFDTLHAFQACALDHYAISPRIYI